VVYVLQAFLGRADLLGHHLDASPLARLVTLHQGFGMIPITGVLRADLHVGSLVKEEAYPEGLYYLSAPIVAWAERISRDGPVAYVEAEFSGQGTQAALVWHEGGLLFGPLVTSDEPAAIGARPTSPPLEQWAINRALRLLGVNSRGVRDEFDALGLGAHRYTEEWLQR
jgi:hypothetical protein